MGQLTIDQALQLALQHHHAGRLSEAENIYNRILAASPSHPQATHYLGILAGQLGRHDIAVDLFRRAVQLQPDDAEAYSNLGCILAETGKPDEAIIACRKAVELNPNYAEGFYHLGNALQKAARFEEAVVAYRQAITCRPDHVRAHNNLGGTLMLLDRPDEAASAFHQAIALNPRHPNAHKNLGMALYSIGDCPAAIEALRGELALQPENPDIHWNLSMMLLADGHFREGWTEYEWRWRCLDFPTPLRNFSVAQWDGESLSGRTILLHAEQGFGDTIQFARYIPMVAERGGVVLLECQPELKSLLNAITGVKETYIPGQQLPPFDVHCPLASLSLAFRTTLETIPASIPYLQPDAAKAERWKAKLSDEKQFKIGLAWSGRPTHRNERNRSIPLQMFTPLAQVPHAHFYSLQKGTAARQIADAKELPITDWTDDLTDFADTAALIANLDLIISVDTAVAHLAGAMGKPTWLLLPWAPDWRWMLHHPDTPWYPTISLFRQNAPKQWEEVMERVRIALAQNAFA